jgi:hypothetical protein
MALTLKALRYTLKYSHSSRNLLDEHSIRQHTSAYVSIHSTI